MAFPVFDERAEVVYQRLQSRIKRKFEDDVEAVMEGRPVTNDRADRLENGKDSARMFGNSASAEVNWLEIL
jgi:hypothetical protein